MQLILRCLFPTLFLGMLFSCASVKELQVLQDIDTVDVSAMSIPEVVIQHGDILSITVYSDNPLGSAPFNQQLPEGYSNTQSSGTVPSAGSAQPILRGYIVDQNGNIQMPVLGTISVAGLTKKQIEQKILEKILQPEPLLQNPYLDVRIMNFKVTIDGEVNKPGMYSIPNERINILEAIGLAGGLTYFGDRGTVLVIREIDGKRTVGRLDLKQSNIFKSPYYYLQQNDMVIVNMTKRKVAANDQVLVRNISVVSGVISTIAVLIGVLNR